MNDALKQAISKALESKRPKKELFNPYCLFADAKPSESIQKHELPGLAVACILAIKEGKEMLDVPIKQYKDYSAHNKANRARELTEWLRDERDQGLIISGFSLERTQKAAARFGLDLIEELPDTHVETHYQSYRLHFGNEKIDFAQAVALIYYNLAVSFAILYASNHAPAENKRFLVFMDRFPGASPGQMEPGQTAPKTQGMKFVEFIRERSPTGIGIDKENATRDIKYQSTTLEWWRRSPDDEYKEGKTHPHFSLADWLAGSALARAFEKEFVDSYPVKSKAEDTAKALIELHKEFKNFSIWGIGDDATLDHIVSSEKQWVIPDDARKFILSRAEG